MSLNIFFNLYLSHRSENENLPSIQKLYEHQNRFLKEMNFLRKADLITEKKLSHCFDIICSMQLLRFRVQQHTLFEIGVQEFKGLQKQIVSLLKNAWRQDVSELMQNFYEKIETLEALYQNTLQVVAPDPIPFQFFIHDLYALYAAMVVTNERAA